jgi:hypothetical protein
MISVKSPLLTNLSIITLIVTSMTGTTNGKLKIADLPDYLILTRAILLSASI